MSIDESDFFNDESDDDGFDSRSVGTCTFSFRFDESIGRVGDSVGRVEKSVGCTSGVGSGGFFSTGIYSTGDVVPLVMFVPKGFESKGG